MKILLSVSLIVVVVANGLQLYLNTKPNGVAFYVLAALAFVGAVGVGVWGARLRDGK